VVRKFDHDVARPALAFRALELAAADHISPTEFLEDRGIVGRILLVALVIVHVDACDPVGFCHSRFPSLQAASGGVISARMASATALGSAASTTGRPTTR